jgi:hypothetical protein
MKELIPYLIMFSWWLIGFIAACYLSYNEYPKGERCLTGEDLGTSTVAGVFMPIPVVMVIMCWYQKMEENPEIKWIARLEDKINKNFGQKKFFQEHT